MKKILIILMAVILSFSLAACGGKAAVPIDDGIIWEVSTVLEKASGSIVACSEDMAEANPGADVIELICAAKDGRVTLNCSTTDEMVEGFYAASDSGESTMYIFKFGQFDAAAVTSFTTYEDGTQEKTLVVDTGDYTIYFTE